MKNALTILLVVFLLWLFFDKQKTKKVAQVITKAAPVIQAAAPVAAGGAAINPAPAPAVVPEILVPLLNPAPDYKVDSSTTYTPPPAIAAAIEQKQTELFANPYRPEALAKEAQLQQEEADRQAAELLLRQIRQSIAEAEQKQQAIDQQVRDQEAAAAEKARIENQAKAEDLAFKAANSSQPMQYDATNSPELQRLNAFLVVKDQIVNSAIYEAERLTFLARVRSIENNYRFAYEQRLKGDPLKLADSYLSVAQGLEAALKLDMAIIERRYLATQAQKVNEAINTSSPIAPAGASSETAAPVIVTAPAVNPDIAVPSPDYSSTMMTVDPASGAIITQYRTKLIDTSSIQ